MTSISKKMCRKCLERKPVSDFYTLETINDGLDCYCKECRRILLIEWRRNNRNLINAYQRNWAEKNKEKIAAINKRYHQKKKREKEEKERNK